MCGICGIIDFSNSLIKKHTIKQMADTLEHRGPDSSGIYTNNHIGFGHTRLSIIDLSDNGKQPMVSEDGNIVLTFNGEIYNFEKIRSTLEKKGVPFFSSSDTEVIIKAYSYWDIKSFSLFEGMFAFGLWDIKKQIFYGVRDRFGIKPFYYHPIDKGIVFASEIKAISASGQLEHRIDLRSLHEYLYYGTALGDHSIYKNVNKLLPGYYMTVERNNIQFSPFASILDVKPVTDTFETAISTTRLKLEHAVKSHLISDVPVGIFLSGGIDSSTITAFASKHYSKKLITFTVGYDFDKGVNELPKARIIANHFDTEHHELQIAGGNLPHIIESLVSAHDEPFGDAANIPLYLLCKELKNKIKVVLQGDGGDEVFGGYRRYNVLSIEKLWRVISHFDSLLKIAPVKSAQKLRYSRFLQAMKNSDPAMRMALLLTMESLSSPPTRVFRDELIQKLSHFDPFQRYKHIYSQVKNLDPVQRMLYTDCSILLPDIFLEKVDKPTMASGIEARVPLLDNNLTQYVMGLPSSMKIRNGQKKWLLKKVMRGIVPDSILDGPKTGFRVPYDWWLRTSLNDYMKTILLDSFIHNLGLFDKKSLVNCINEHTTGKANHGFLLWKILNLMLWMKMYNVSV